MTLALDPSPEVGPGIGSGCGAAGEAGRGADCDPAIAGAQADEGYFTKRMLASVTRASASADSLARLAHYELAGRYSVAALAAVRRRRLDGCRQ